MIEMNLSRYVYGMLLEKKGLKEIMLDNIIDCKKLLNILILFKIDFKRHLSSKMFMHIFIDTSNPPLFKS